MKYKQTIIASMVALGMALTTALPVEASSYLKTRASSAALVMSEHIQTEKKDTRVEKLQAYLASYNSPLADYAEVFVKEADKNQIDWRWVTAIAGVESYFGQMIPPYSYNGWGYGVYGGNVRRFDSWEDGIATVSKALRRDYLNRWGATNLNEIGAIYAADPAWSRKVQHFMNDMEEFESRTKNITLSLSL